MEFPAYLKREFDRRRGRNSRYSLRAFARDLSCDHATLSQWMRRARPMSSEAVDQLCKALGLTGADRERACAIDQIDLQVIDLVRATPHRTTDTLAAHAGVPVDRVNISLAKLLRLEVLRMEGPEWRVQDREVA